MQRLTVYWSVTPKTKAGRPHPKEHRQRVTAVVELPDDMDRNSSEAYSLIWKQLRTNTHYGEGNVFPAWRFVE